MTDANATHRFDDNFASFNCRILGDYAAGLRGEVVVVVADDSHKWHGKTLAAQGRHLTALDVRPRTGEQCPECGADMVAADEYITECVACDHFHNAEPDWDSMRGGHDYDPGQ